MPKLLALLAAILVATSAVASDPQRLAGPFPDQVASTSCPAPLVWDPAARSCVALQALQGACSVLLTYDPQDPSKVNLQGKPGPGCAPAALEYALDAARARLRWITEAAR